MFRDDATGQNQAQLTLGRFNSKLCRSDTTWTYVNPVDLLAPMAFNVDGFQISDYKSKKRGFGKVDSGVSVMLFPYGLLMFAEI